MASVSTSMPAVTFTRPNPFPICFKEAKYEFLKCLRLPMYAVSIMLFPIMCYILFGLVMSRQTINGISTTVYLIPAYGARHARWPMRHDLRRDGRIAVRDCGYARH